MAIRKLIARGRYSISSEARHLLNSGLWNIHSRLFFFFCVIQSVNSEWVMPAKGNSIALIKRCTLTGKERRKICVKWEKSSAGFVRTRNALRYLLSTATISPSECAYVCKHFQLISWTRDEVFFFFYLWTTAYHRTNRTTRVITCSEHGCGDIVLYCTNFPETDSVIRHFLLAVWLLILRQRPNQFDICRGSATGHRQTVQERFEQGLLS